jgi:hypothetical protein
VREVYAYACTAPFWKGCVMSKATQISGQVVHARDLENYALGGVNLLLRPLSDAQIAEAAEAANRAWAGAVGRFAAWALA